MSPGGNPLHGHLNIHMNEKLTIGLFSLGCVIIVAVILAVQHINRLEDLIIKQQDTIETQHEAIMMQRLENSLLKRVAGY
jgi:hypothetical protein